MDHDPDLHDPSDGGREEEWAEHQQLHGIRPSRSNGPNEMCDEMQHGQVLQGSSVLALCCRAIMEHKELLKVSWNWQIGESAPRSRESVS